MKTVVSGSQNGRARIAPDSVTAVSGDRYGADPARFTHRLLSGALRRGRADSLSGEGR